MYIFTQMALAVLCLSLGISIILALKSAVSKNKARLKTSKYDRDFDEILVAAYLILLFTAVLFSLISRGTH